MSHNSSALSGHQKVNEPVDFVRDFLFRRPDVCLDDTCIRSPLLLDVNLEGWIGIPHGGIGMGAIMELATILNNYPEREDLRNPLSVDFRMGGARVRTGDVVNVKVSPTESGAEGIIIVEGNTFPYISAAIGYRNDDAHRKDVFESYIPDNFSHIENNLIQLPYYRNCFVCGVERGYPGLKRSFSLLSDYRSGKLIVSTVGFDDGDKETFYLFQRNSIIHPLALIALLDETMGWAGFMASASGAVTVRIGFTFYRDVHVGEKLVVLGRGEKVRGNVGSRLFYWASGGVAVVDDKGRLEIVITASGQYMGVDDLTAQMKMELIPQEFTSRAFSLASS
jgi:acyl-coenzyme A thioesterase PaaI-like protein